MCKEMPVIPVNKLVDPKITIEKNGEEERHKGSLTKKNLLAWTSETSDN
jgi:hypothetical protein